MYFNDKKEIAIISSEKIPCPICGGKLSGRDSRVRQLIGADGNVMRLRIRRLRCKGCGRIHSELPDIVQPFKHYASAVIQEVLDGNTDGCPAEDSTIRRWRLEFASAVKYIESILISLWMQGHRKPWRLLNPVPLLEKLRGWRPRDWYAFVNRLLVNSGADIYTQPAF